MSKALVSFVFLNALLALKAFSQSDCKAPNVQDQVLPPLVYQTTDYTCGPASALSLLQSWGIKNQNEMALAKVLGTTVKDGTLPKDFIKGFKDLKIKAEYLEKIDLKKLKALFEQKLGLIALVDSEGDHWVLIVSFDDKKITTMDPWPDKCGYTTYTYSEFNKVWHGKIGDQAVVVITKP
jgi:ABC-type bacteriocin/lantibiotic exporter with double-glycine peptidase domain